MNKKDFFKTRKIKVTVDGEAFYYNSFAEMIDDFDDITNHDEWAHAHHSDNGKSCVFHAHRFDTIGKIVERDMTKVDAETFADQLNQYFAVRENHSVEEV